MKLKLSVITMVLLCVIVENQASQYTGVCWDKDKKKWKAQLTHNYKKVHGGLFENEEHAAMKVNLLCDKYGIKRKNPMIIIEPHAIQQHFKIKTSIYFDVSWNNNAKKWQAMLYHNQKHNYGGLFDKEEDAAMKINLLCDMYAIERKNPMIDIELFEDHQVHNQTSKYAGVTWNKNNKCWQAQLQHNNKKYHGGNFDKEEHAAMNINLLCDKLGLKRKNPMIDIEFDRIQKVHNSTSQYIGVSWNKNTKTWQAQLMHKGKKYFAGLFDNEKHAAMKVNLLCDKLGIQRKNPMIDIEFDVIPQGHNSTSKYTGVYWDKNRKKWKAQMVLKGKKYCGGHFDYEKHAAMKVNLLCDKLGKQRKNPMVDIEFDAIEQKTKSNQSKAENLANEKEAKVEEDNILYGLKDQCENNFMNQTYQSQKRKRNKD